MRKRPIGTNTVAHGPAVWAWPEPPVGGRAPAHNRWRRLLARRHVALHVPFVVGGHPIDEKDAFCFERGVFAVPLTPLGVSPYGWCRLRFVQRGEANVTDLTLELVDETGIRTLVIAPKKNAKNALCIDEIIYISQKTRGLWLRGRTLTTLELKNFAAKLQEVSKYDALLAAHPIALPRRVPRISGTSKLVFKAMHELKANGIAGVMRRAQQMRHNTQQKHDYQRWVTEHDELSEQDRKKISAHIKSWDTPPLISIITPTYNTPPELLEACIASVRNQIYPYWQLCIADDASPQPHVVDILGRAARDDKRIKFVRRSTNGHISAASNTALQMASGHWIALLDHDDTLSAHALYLVANEIIKYPDSEIIYSDEDKIEVDNTRVEPYFKPDFSPDLLLSQNYISHLGVYRKKTVEAVGGFRSMFDGSQDYDLVLRVSERVKPQNIRHIPHILYHWRKTQGSAASGAQSKPYAYIAAELALTEHFSRTGQSASVRPSAYRGLFYSRYAVPEPPPRVSIIVPTKDRVHLLRACIDSIIQKSTYRDFEIIIVDNDSQLAQTQRYLQDVALWPRVCVVSCPGPFNFSLLNNVGRKHATGQLLALVNNDIEVDSSDWLEEMVALALRPKTGAVGAKLLYPDGSIQHGGVVLGVGGVAGHAHKGLPHAFMGNFGRANLTQNFSAVTAACMVVKANLYDQVGGLDEDLKVSYNDLDFCLKLGDLGLYNVWTPHAVLLHRESASRGLDDVSAASRFQDEYRLICHRWGKQVENDPFYNPNLTLDSEHYVLGEEPRAHLPCCTPKRFRQPLPHILAKVSLGQRLGP